MTLRKSGMKSVLEMGEVVEGQLLLVLQGKLAPRLTLAYGARKIGPRPHSTRTMVEGDLAIGEVGAWFDFGLHCEQNWLGVQL